MAAESRRTDPPLDQELFDEPYRFDFFQAVRLLERIDPRRLPIGHEGDARRESVRFRTRQTLSFPPSEIYQLIKNGSEDENAPPEMMVAFMGATGPLGVLPHQYTELLMERARYKDTALWTFLDIFNHRMISLFYRAWEKHHFPIAYERGLPDQFTAYLFDTVGIGTRGLRNRLLVEDQALIFYGGLVAQRPHSASAIESILSDYFGAPARLGQFAGQWLNLGDNVTQLGSANSQLGMTTIAGARVWEDQSKFRIKFGPLEFNQFQDFVPAGSAFKPATELARLLVGLEFDFDVQLILKAKEVPACVMRTGEGTGPRLGWTSWLKTEEFASDDDQVVLQVND
ncbi:MAG TPA: type VI secretion system baseplate subunit TssG [Pyrinomonadaceae bacterium]|nr:type VI secretion system baseplate subunit TssG [Pyrinomonadaceae bacterium]